MDLDGYDMPSWVNKTILIVEDNIDNKEYIEELLFDTGVEILSANTGAEALEIFQNNQSINLVLMDIQLPDTNGHVLTRTMKKVNPKLVIIAQTAYASSDDKDDCLNAGCNDFIAKPIHPKIFFNTILKYLK